jgi:hypothetical protein
LGFGNGVTAIVVPSKGGRRCGSKTLIAVQNDTVTDRLPGYLSNPGGRHEELTTSSRADEATTTPLTLSGLPPELTLRIAFQLDVRDLLALRKVRFKLGKLKYPQTYQAKTEQQVDI